MIKVMVLYKPTDSSATTTATRRPLILAVIFGHGRARSLARCARRTRAIRSGVYEGDTYRPRTRLILTPPASVPRMTNGRYSAIPIDHAVILWLGKKEYWLDALRPALFIQSLAVPVETATADYFSFGVADEFSGGIHIGPSVQS